MQEQYVKLSDLRKVKGIGEKTIKRIKNTLLHNQNNQYDDKNIKYKDTFDLPLNNFYIGESVKWMQKNMPNNFIDLTVTSPPYDNLRNYKGYKFDYKAMLKELYRVTKDGGVVVWVVNDATINGSETGTSFRHALYAMDIGFNLHDTMIYAKYNPIPLNHRRYEQQFEYMFIFSKGKPKTFIPKKTKVTTKIKPCKDKHHERHYRRGNTLRGHKKEKIKSNIWYYKIGQNQTTKDKIAFKHPAQFPEQLAEDHILSWSNEGDIVLDPMCGAGTTCKMAYLNNRKFIGIDCSDEYINNICIPRLKEYGWK